MRNNIRTIVLLVIAMLLVIPAACASSSSVSTPSTLGKGDMSQVSEGLIASAPAPAVAPQGSRLTYDEITAGGESSIDRKIVRTASLTIQVTDISQALADIAALAAGFEGYVVSSSQRADDDNTASGQISIRVPATQYDAALQKLRELAVKVVYENSNSQDVTEQYTDLQAQLRNYEATEAQYLELLKKAENVKDMLEVQEALSNVRGNIERVKGRIQYLERTSETSLIQVSLTKVKPIGESTWDVPGILKGAVDGLIAFGNVLLTILIWLLVFSPVWIIILVIIWLVRRKKSRVTAQK